MKIKEIIVNYSEKRTKDYQSESHNAGMVINDITEADLKERSIEEWFYFYDNKVHKIVNETFRTEKKNGLPAETFDKKEAKELFDIVKDVEKSTQVEESNYVIASFIRTSDTGKAELYMNPEGLETWVPKAVIKSYSESQQKLTLVNAKCIQKYINWSEPK